MVVFFTQCKHKTSLFFSLIEHLLYQYLRRHANVAWDELCGGMVRGITVETAHNDKFMKDKVAWVQQEGNSP